MKKKPARHPDSRTPRTPHSPPSSQSPGAPRASRSDRAGGPPRGKNSRGAAPRERADHSAATTPRRAETGDSPRDAALAFIAHQAARFPRLDLRPFHAPTLAGRDAALAHAIADATIRRWLTLAWLVQQRCRQPLATLEAPLRAALLGGAAQIVLLDKVPAHAAINHAVEWAKRRIRPGAGHMVNAVLRRVSEMIAQGGTAPAPHAHSADAPAQHASAAAAAGAQHAADSATTGQPAPAQPLDTLPLADGRSIPLRGITLPADPLERLEITTSHPRALLSLWAQRFGIEATATLAHHSITQPPVILNLGSDAYLPLPPGTLTPHDEPGFAVYSGDHDALVTLLNDRDDLWVQDPSSAQAVLSAIDLRPAPRVIFDLCAGMGTKTRQLARAFPSARLFASDTDQRRLAVLRETFRGHPRVSVIEPRNLALDHAGAADLVLLDVPCSNSGVLARRPEARYRLTQDSLNELADVQRQIIADSIPLLSPRGSILYSTCSLEDGENTAHVAWAHQWHKLVASRQRLTLPAGAPGSPPSTYRDGSFSVLLSHA